MENEIIRRLSHVLSRISALIAGQKKGSVITSLLLKDQAAVITSWFYMKEKHTSY
ncbi:MAG: hypothetical protein PWR10_481 [Halanaerobiales bacterium]|nr:hypothetical protein [Halanaerobiales bacterium]